jgi:hypothetical protein
MTYPAQFPLCSIATAIAAGAVGQSSATIAATRAQRAIDRARALRAGRELEERRVIVMASVLHGRGGLTAAGIGPCAGRGASRPPAVRTLREVAGAITSSSAACSVGGESGVSGLSTAERPCVWGLTSL